jgi:hypothetical protein
VQACAAGCTDFSGEACAATPALPGDLNGDHTLDCLDIRIIQVSLGKKAGDPGFDPHADVTGDKVVDVRDLAWESRLLPPGLTCH